MTDDYERRIQRESGSDEPTCPECGASNFRKDGRFGCLVCDECEYMPPKSTRDEIREQLDKGAAS